MAGPDTASRWLPVRPRGRAGLPLFCLPHAGGSASAFRTWLDRVPGVEVRPVQPPGREARFREPAYQAMPALVADLAEVIAAELAAAPGGYAVYGHSLGALVAFELTRALRRRGLPEPVRLIVSGSVAPEYNTEDGPPVLGMSRAEVVAMLRRLGGTPDWLLADPTALDLVLPAFRADFSVKETYRYQSEAPLTTPITVLASTDDPRAAHATQAAWRGHTLGAFGLHTLIGGHFAVYEQATLTCQLIAETLKESGDEYGPAATARPATTRTVTAGTVTARTAAG